MFIPNDEREAAAAAAAEANGDVAMKEEKAEGEEGDEKKDDEEGDEEEAEEEETAAQVRHNTTQHNMGVPKVDRRLRCASCLLTVSSIYAISCVVCCAPSLQLLAKDIMSRVGGDDKAVQPIAKFNLMFQSPRGRYDINMYPSYMKLASKTFQYKILYKYVHQMFLFDNPQTSQHFFIIGLNPPIRQGRTSHAFLLVAFDNDDVEEQFNIDEKTCLETYKNIFQPTMKGKQFDVVTRVFKALTDRKVLVPGMNFSSKIGGSCVRCNLKANDGYLYCMEKSFFFVKKPLMYIRHTDIQELSFERLSNSSTGSKSFDLRIVTNEEKNNEHIFSGIQRDEYQNLFNFLKDKKLNLTTQFEGVRKTHQHTHTHVHTYGMKR